MDDERSRIMRRADGRGADGVGPHAPPEEIRTPDPVPDPEDRHPFRPRISHAASLALVVVLSILAWALVLALT